MKNKSKISKKSLEQLEDFQIHWKRIRAISEPWILCAGAHDMPDMNSDEEDSFIKEKEWIAKNLIPVSLTIGGNEERASVVAKGIKQLLDMATSLRDLGTSPDKKKNFQAQWNYTNNRIGVALSMFEKGADVKKIKKQEETLYPSTARKKDEKIGKKILMFVIYLLAFWKLLDIAYTTIQIAKYGESCATYKNSGEKSVKTDCLPNFIPFWD